MVFHHIHSVWVRVGHLGGARVRRFRSLPTTDALLRSLDLVQRYQGSLRKLTAAAVRRVGQKGKISFIAKSILIL